MKILIASLLQFCACIQALKLTNIKQYAIPEEVNQRAAIIIPQSSRDSPHAINVIHIESDVEKTRNYLTDSCANSEECSHSVTNSECVSGACQCQESFVPLANNLCLPRSTYIGDSCQINEQCTDLDPSAACYEGSCVCEPFFHVSHATIVQDIVNHKQPFVAIGNLQVSVSCVLQQKLGDSCVNDRQCSTKVSNSECDDNLNICLCEDGYLAVGNQLCMMGENAIPLASPCTLDRQCVGPETICLNSTCQCASGYVPNEGECLPARDIGEECSENVQCTTPNAVCSEEECSCDENFVSLGSGLSVCLPERRLSETCKVSQQCVVDSNVCDPETRTCINHVKCAALLRPGSSCESAPNCCASGSKCEDNICTCPPGTTSTLSGSLCRANKLQFSRQKYATVARPCCNGNGEPVVLLSLSFTQDSSLTPGLNVEVTPPNSALQIDADRNLIALEPIENAITVKIVATDGDLSAETQVVINTDPCCSELTSLQAPVGPIFLFDSDPATTDGCNGVGEEDAALNADALLDLNDYRQNVCDQETEIVNPTVVEGPCALTGTVVQYTGVETPNMAVVCEISYGINACNGLSSDNNVFELEISREQCCDQVNIINGGFETGDTSGWNFTDLTLPIISGRVFEDSFTAPSPIGSTLPIFTPSEGSFALFNFLDGNGPGSICLEQSITLCRRANLMFSYSLASNIGIRATQDKVFNVIILDKAREVLETIEIARIPFDSEQFFTGEQSGLVNLFDYGGQDVYIKFEWFLPEARVGPGGFVLDDIKLDCCINN